MLRSGDCEHRRSRHVGFFSHRQITPSPHRHIAHPVGCHHAADVAAVESDQAAAALTRDLVQDDEVIILMLRPSLWYVFLSSLGGLGLIALVTLALAYMAKFMSSL